MRCSCAASRAHSITSCRAAAWIASAVPHAPAPRTAMRMRVCVAVRRPSGRGDHPAAIAAGRRLRLLLRFVHRLEVDFGEQDRWEARARADIGHDGAQIGVEDLRTHDADDALQLLVRDVTDLEDAGLLGL